MKALTLHQPWAWAIVAAGKDIENRTWKPPTSILGHRIAIHAGKTFDLTGANDICDMLHLEQLPAAAEEGGIVGTAIIAGWEAISSSRWFNGPIGWRLTGIQRLATPIPCRGAQRLWTVPPEIAALVERNGGGE